MQCATIIGKGTFIRHKFRGKVLSLKFFYRKFTANEIFFLLIIIAPLGNPNNKDSNGFNFSAKLDSDYR